MSTKNLRVDITKDYLVEEYLDKNKTPKVIAKMLGCNRRTVNRRILFYNIKKKIYTEISEDTLIKEYVDNELSTSQIAIKLKSSSETIRRKLI